MTYFLLIAILFLVAGVAYEVRNIGKKANKIMAGQADLDAAIAALPAQIEAKVEAALAPIIAAIQAKAGNVDLSAEIASLNAVGDTVATQVATDLTPKS